MPKKAKKGGAGGGKTEEERLLYLQQRAQAEEEMAKKKEEILALFLKDKLQKEERNTAVNLLKLNDGWRSILRQTRAAELRSELTVFAQTFERHLDGLDSVIKNLERDLQEAERQSAQVRRVHLQQVERLWAQQDKRLQFEQQQWESGLQHLSSRFSSERTQMSGHAQQQRADLGDATFALELQHKKVMDEIHRVYSEGIASYQGAHEDRKAAVVLKVKDKLKAKVLENQESEQVYSKATVELDRVLAKDRRLIQTTRAKVKATKKLQEVAVRLRMRLNYRKTEKQSLEEDLTAGRDQVNRKTRALRDQLTQAQTAARKQLTDLTVQSDAAAKKLRAVIAKGEKVLRVAEMCRKLESEQNVFSSHREQRAGAEPEEPAEDVSELQQLMRSIDAAVLRREALKNRKDHLSRENQQLRLLLRQHLDAMRVGDRALEGGRAPLTVYQAPIAAAPPDSDRRHTVIEAVHAVKHSL